MNAKMGCVRITEVRVEGSVEDYPAPMAGDHSIGHPAAHAPLLARHALTPFFSKGLRTEQTRLLSAERLRHSPYNHAVIADPLIALAEPAEAQAIALLSRDEIEHGLRWSWTAPRVLRAIRDRSTNVVVARDGDSVVGFALLRYEADRAHLLLLGVARSRRRHGIATALWRWLEETLGIAGVGAVQVELRQSNIVARAFYEKLGFELINATTKYYQGAETALHMVKELSPQEE
jgi:ribosomal-protein-alanine N-acetyltransferase